MLDSEANKGGSNGESEKFISDVNILLLNLLLYRKQLKDNPNFWKIIRQLKGTLEALDGQPGLPPDKKFLAEVKEKARELIFNLNDNKQSKN